MSLAALSLTHAADRIAIVRGIGLTLVSGILFAVSNAAAKLAMHDIPPGELLCARAVVGLGVVSLFIPIATWRALLSDGEWRLHLLRNLCSGLEVFCFYWAVARTPLADVSTIYLATPIYVTALAAIFLHEPVGWRRWSAVLAGFVGVLVALHPAGATVSAPVLVAMCGSLLYATSLVVTRRLRATPSTLLVATQLAALIVVSSASATFGWVVPTAGQSVAMVAIGLVSMVAYWAMNQGLRLAAASAVAPFNYSSIVWAILLGFVVFGDIPAPATLLGAAIIVCAGLFIMLRETQVGAPTAG